MHGNFTKAYSHRDYDIILWNYVCCAALHCGKRNFEFRVAYQIGSHIADGGPGDITSIEFRPILRWRATAYYIANVS